MLHKTRQPHYYYYMQQAFNQITPVNSLLHILLKIYQLTGKDIEVYVRLGQSLKEFQKNGSGISISIFLLLIFMDGLF